jgi:hypothetical protein
VSQGLFDSLMVDGTVVESYYIRAGCIVTYRHGDIDLKDRSHAHNGWAAKDGVCIWLFEKSIKHSMIRTSLWVRAYRRSSRYGEDDLVGNTVKMQKADRASRDKVPSFNRKNEGSLHLVRCNGLVGKL